MRMTCLRNIYAVSDLHTDHADNLCWAAALNDGRFKSDVLIVGGDISCKIGNLFQTLDMLRSAFALVFFTPGNHDLWVRSDGSEGENSLAKWQRLEEECEERGIVTTPQRVRLRTGTVSIAPLLSFHHRTFDSEPDITAIRMPNLRSAVYDYRACRWPAPLETGDRNLADYFDGLNQLQLDRSAIQAAARPKLLKSVRRWEELHYPHARLLISFSHFVPRIELCPEKRFLRYPDLLKAVGSLPLGGRVARLKPDLHVFGHTHFGWDAEIDGVRYVQAALGTPRERSWRMHTLSIGEIDSAPLKVYDDAAGALCPPCHAMWSTYYKVHQRNPENTEPAKWLVHKRMHRKKADL
mmetsp:Transcript_50868/g.84313  ORF Transcript_50868/g.84313 Transcript_50868/m.84313 type:complete len:352 (-) Transcript_50868:304-1359(-)